MSFFRSSLLVLFSLLIILSCTGVNKLSVEELMREAGIAQLPTQDDFPDDGGVILYENFYDRLYLDSDYNVRVEETVQRAVLYFNEKADSWTNQIIYLNDQSTLTNFTAYTKKPNGEIIYLTEKDLHPTHVNESFQKVSHEKSLRIVFPGVEPGSILYYGYTINHKGFFSGYYWFVESSLPKVYTKYSIEIPKLFFRYGYDWNYSSFNFSIDAPQIVKNLINETSTKDASIILYWELREIPAFKKEPFSPPFYDIAKYVSIDLRYKNWDELGKLYLKMVKKYFSQENSTEVKSLSNKICQGARSKEEKIKKIFEYVQKEFHYLAFDLGESGLIPHTFSEIIRNKYGDCKDMSVLQVNLLRAQNIEAYPALVATKSRSLARPSFISLKNFNHMIVFAKADSGKEYWLDATGDICPLGEIYPAIEGQYALILFDRNKIKFKKIPASTCDQNLIKRIVEINLDEDQKINGHTRLIYQGNPAISLRNRLRAANDDDVNKFVKKYINAHAGDINISNLKYDLPDQFKSGMTIEFDLFKENFGNQLNNLIVVNPAIFKLGSDLEKLVDEKRRYPIYLGSPITISDEIHLRFSPDKLKIEGLFNTLSCTKSFGNFVCKVENPEKGHIVYRRIYRLFHGLINKRYYNDLKEMEKMISRAAEQNIALKKL